MMTTFGLTISYGQVAAFDPELSEPFNNWREEHVAQGFAWRPGTVSFRTLAEGGAATVTVKRSHVHQVREDALRAISVPFLVPGHRMLEVASVGDGQRIEMPPGEYQLVFEHGVSTDDQMWLSFAFVPVRAPVNAEILRADPALTPPEKLLMEADPA